jgi:hypothetical protein
VYDAKNETEINFEKKIISPDKIGVRQLPLFNYFELEGKNDNSLHTFVVEGN